MSAPVLRVVGGDESTDDRIRGLILELDALRARTADVEQRLAVEARVYADEKGLTMRPRLAQLKRDLGVA